ncbi:MAG TPA: energy transducer TonB, partial [Burkholderiaceae bacterium]|nr:energy transducer TonB [Burkholderiaceae bacterium]
MVAAATTLHTPILAWSVSAEDEERFKRILRTVLAICLLIAIIMPWLPVREPDRTVAEPLPPRLAKLLLDREMPPPVIPKPERPVTKDETKAQPTMPKAEPKPAVVEARRPEANKPPGEKLENARARMSGVGLLAMKNELQELHAAPAAVQLNKDIKPGPGVGSGVGPGVGAGVGPGVPTRSLITSNATGGSGGINTAAYSRDTGGGGLAGRSTTLVEGVAGGAGGGGP